MVRRNIIPHTCKVSESLGPHVACCVVSQEVDLYALISGVTYYNDLPVLDGMYYRALVDKTYDVLEDGVIYKGEIGYNERVEDVNGKDMLCIYFGKGDTSLSKREYYDFDEVEVVKQIKYPNGYYLLGEIIH